MEHLELPYICHVPLDSPPDQGLTPEPLIYTLYGAHQGRTAPALPTAHGVVTLSLTLPSFLP